METRVHEIADGVYRLSTFVPAVNSAIRGASLEAPA